MKFDYHLTTDHETQPFRTVEAQTFDAAYALIRLRHRVGPKKVAVLMLTEREQVTDQQKGKSA